MSIVSNLCWEDERVDAGLRAQLGERDGLLAAGAERLGWKLAFGTEEAKRRWGIPGPVLGHLTSATRLAEGAPVAISTWTAPVLEPEIAVLVAADAGVARVGGIAIAIELADLGEGGADLAATIAGNIYHRGFLVGPTREPADSLSVTVLRDGEPSALQTDPFAAVGGRPDDFVAYVAAFLAARGERLSDGEVLLTGSVVPPLGVAPGERIEVRSDALGALEIELRGDQE